MRTAEKTEQNCEYNNDTELPIFKTGKKNRYTVREATSVLLCCQEQRKCKKTPLRVRQNMSFVNVSNLTH